MVRNGWRPVKGKPKQEWGYLKQDNNMNKRQDTILSVSPRLQSLSSGGRHLYSSRDTDHDDVTFDHRPQYIQIYTPLGPQTSDTDRKPKRDNLKRGQMLYTGRHNSNYNTQSQISSDISDKATVSVSVRSANILPPMSLEKHQTSCDPSDQSDTPDLTVTNTLPHISTAENKQDE